MTTLFKSVSRLWRAMATRSRSFGTAGEATIKSPNILILPSYVVGGRTQASFAKPYSPDDLMDLILGDANAVDSIGTIFVTQIYYYKEDSEAQHEYLVFKVEDSGRRFINYLKLDRTPDNNNNTRPPSPSSHNPNTSTPKQDAQTKEVHNVRSVSENSIRRFFSSSSSSELFGKRDARDKFYISDTGEIESFPNIKSSNLLGTIEISWSNASKPTVEDIVLLAAFVSASRPHYHLFRTQCYWYAYTCWQLLLLAFPNSLTFDGELSGAGRGPIIPWIEWHRRAQPDAVRRSLTLSERETHAHLAARYLTELHDFNAMVPERQKKYGARMKEKRMHEAEAKAAQAEEEIVRAKARAEDEIAQAKLHAEDEIAQAKLHAEEEIARAKEYAEAQVAQANAKNAILMQEMEELRALKQAMSGAS
ncbi:hypothetical protein FRC12_024242 [Ceratobasidium sp. 428]|nr:hypothetical protein FRC12_024242 [Ceratobasidium sp. 428]